MRLLEIIKSHWLALAVAFIVGAIVIMPTVVTIVRLGDDWRGIYPMFVDDELHYLALTREVYDGHFNLGNAFLKEGKDKPYLQQPVAEMIFAGAAKITGLSIPAVFAAGKFVFPFIGVLVLYAFILSLTRSRPISAVTAAFFYAAFLYSFGRPINPQFSFILFIICLFLVYKISFLLPVGSQAGRPTTGSLSNTGPRQQKQNFIFRFKYQGLLTLNLILAFCFGILFYIYPYHWMTILAVYGLSLLFSAWRSKKWKPYILSGLFFAVPVAAIIIPYAVNLLAAARDPYYAETFVRFGFIYTRWPASFFNVGLLFLTFCVLTIFRKKILSAPLQNFLYALVIGGVVLNWQNVITGQNLHLSHHFYPVTVLIVTVVLSVIVSVIAKNLSIRLWSEKIGFTLCAIILILIGSRQIAELKSAVLNAVNPPDNREDQRLAEVAEWLTVNASKDSAMYILGKKLEWLVPAYTPHNLYYSGYAPMYLMSDSELEDRWIIQHLFDTSEYIQLNSESILLAKFSNAYQNAAVRRKIASWFGIKNMPEPANPVGDYRARILYQYYVYKNQPFDGLLKKYAADYVMVDTMDPRYDRVLPFFEQHPNLFARAAVIGGVYVYKVL